MVKVSEPAIAPMHYEKVAQYNVYIRYDYPLTG
jgi:hypothetical protein